MQWLWPAVAALELVVILVLWQQLFFDRNLVNWLRTHKVADLEEEAAIWEERARHLGWRDEHEAPNAEVTG